MSKQIVKFPAAGCIVEFMQGGRSVQAWVLGEQSGQLRLYTINKRETKLQAARLLPWSGPQLSASASRAEMDAHLEQARALREKIATSLDLSQLWELAQGEVRQAELIWFAELLWPEPDINQVAALGQAMLAQKTHFKFSPPHFEIYTAEEVAGREEKQARAERITELVAVGSNFFKHLLEASRNAANTPLALDEKDLPPPDMAEELKNILMERVADPDSHDADNIWKTLTKNLSAKNVADDPHLAVLLATAWGIVPPHYNYLLDRAGYEAGDDWAAGGADFIKSLQESLQGKLADLPKLDGERSFISIDPDETQDFDDAFYLEETSGGFLLSVPIACPAWLWPFESAFDKQVLRRCTSLYFPEGNNYMLPRGLCLKSYSLQAGKERPVLLFNIELDKELNVLGLQPQFGRLALAANLSLSQSEALLQGQAAPAPECSPKPSAGDSAPQSGQGITAATADMAPAGTQNNAQPAPGLFENKAAPYADMLVRALAFARALRQKRIDNGAVITERNDAEISLHDDDGKIIVDIRPGKNYELSQLIVGELMILCNAALASWAAEKGIALIFRTQAATLPKDSAGVWTDPADIHRILKGAPPAKSGVEAKPHAGLGVEAYTSLTAPMRRYPDLLNQAQILSYINEGRPRLDKEALEGLMPLLSARQDAVGQIQRFRTRYWKLLYLEQQDQLNKGLHYWEAVITDDNNAFVTAVLRLTGVVLRGPRHLFGDKVSVGATVGIRVGKINALRNEIQIMEVVDY